MTALRYRGTLVEVSQFVVIVLISLASAYVFQRTQFLVFDHSLYTSIVYLAAILCALTSLRRDEYLTGMIPFCLAVPAIIAFLFRFEESGRILVDQIIALFPAFVPLLSILFGISATLLNPFSKAKGFFTFILLLILPGLLAVSAVDWMNFFVNLTTFVSGTPANETMHPMIETSLTFNEVSIAIVTVVAGFFYLRFTRHINEETNQLTLRGGLSKNISEVKWSSILLLTTVVMSAAVTTILVIAAAHIVSYGLPITGALPFHFLLFGAGITIFIAIYAYSKILVRGVETGVKNIRETRMDEHLQERAEIPLEQLDPEDPYGLLLHIYRVGYPHNPTGVLEFHISQKTKAGKTRMQALRDLLQENVHANENLRRLLAKVGQTEEKPEDDATGEPVQKKPSELPHVTLITNHPPQKYPDDLLVKYRRMYPHNPKGVLEFHLSRKMKAGKTKEQAIEELRKKPPKKRRA
ncbi:MAG: hypothetical protein OEX77_05805 [Candidatus Bathyarchaeota archaeon]|nr:hypothetical protein [Candidatus Bathyarchaeota archaeon]